MAFNGAGVFVRLYNWVTDNANNVPITDSRMDGEMDGFATGLSNCLTKDGQQTPIANIPMGSFKLTGLGSGTISTDAVNYGQVFTSPTFVGTPLAPTAALGNSTTQIATTAFAQTMQSPTFTGVPTAPTATVGNNTTQLATTAFVVATSLGNQLPGQTGKAGDVITSDGTTASWTNSIVLNDAMHWMGV